MKILIAGFGSIGRRHFRNLLAMGQTDILFLRSLKSTLETEELKGFVVETSLNAALAHKPDAVVIANPTAMHLDVAIPAASQGCSLLIEKPISDSLNRTSDLQEALFSASGKALMAFQFRFHPGLQKVKDLLEENAIGKVVSAHAQWGEYLPGWHPWEDYRNSYSARRDLGGGVVHTLSHPLDYLHWLLGDVSSVCGYCAQIPSLQIETEAVAEIGLNFASGAIANIHLDYIQRPGVHELEIIGDQGTIRWDNADGAVQYYSAVEEKWQKFPLRPGFERNDLFLAEMQHFLDMIEKNVAPICSLDDGIMAEIIANAVLQSSAEKRLIEL